jgi:amino acid transporter
MKLSHLLRRKSAHQILADMESGFGDGEGGAQLHRTLKTRDLTFFGIAAIIGAGIFGTIGAASYNGGPAVSLLFVFIAVACGFAALCYAEFASMIPISGSAYTYSYITFGELVAWIIGWDLLMEYSIGNITVALSWSAYFQTFIAGFGLHLPEYLTTDFVTALTAFRAGDASDPHYLAWVTAPQLAGLRLIVDLPAMFITVFITALIYIGIRESRTAANLMVALKLIVVILVILIGFFYVNPENWVPFAPNGLAGVMKGVAAVFFAYIGFDAISTVAEECENPQRDLPRGMVYSLIICTILYILMSFVLTGMTNYKNLNVEDPLAYIFTQVEGLSWLSGIVALSAIIATTSVFLVFQLGQPRIWMSMSRDGLLPKKFATIHPKFKTPGFSTIMTGFLVAVPLLFLNFTLVTNLTSIGTLFAFVLVCGGVLMIHYDRHSKKHAPGEGRRYPDPKFKVPYISGRWIVPVGFAVCLLLIYLFNREAMMNFLLFRKTSAPEAGFLKVARENLPYWIFIIYSLFISWYAFRYHLSLLPILGLTMCVYLMSELHVTTWEGFTIWLVAGLIIYFFYSYRNSKLNKGTPARVQDAQR